MNCMNIGNVINGQAAFYAWQCITLQLENRDIDLVIPNDDDMDCFIEVIVEAMNTVNGSKDSAEVIYKVIETHKYHHLYKNRKQLE